GRENGTESGCFWRGFVERTCANGLLMLLDNNKHQTQAMNYHTNTKTFRAPALPASFRRQARKARACLIGAAIATCMALSAYAQTPATISDIGSAPPTVGPNDISHYTAPT